MQSKTEFTPDYTLEDLPMFALNYSLKGFQTQLIERVATFSIKLISRTCLKTSSNKANRTIAIIKI